MMMQDKIEILGKGSKIQHGELNKRVYLMKLDVNDSPFIIQQINSLARKYRYSKIFCKILEAQIPSFYKGTETAFLVSKFLNSDRLLEIETDKLYEFSKILKEADKIQNRESTEKSNYKIRMLNKNDSEKITAVYRKIFETYPFPIHNPMYILNMIQEGVQYFAIEIEKQIVALASADVDKNEQNAEMTDFATLPQYRSKGMALMLLSEMEKQMKKQGIKTLYTIARLKSPGINKIFLKMGYTFSGTLIKNTNIAGKIESMNVYYKHIK